MEKKNKQDTLISADQNRQMFDLIANRYDFMNKVMSLLLDRYWRMRAAKILNPQKTDSILDIGSGTGDMVLEILKQKPGVKVTGIDPAEQMLLIAKKKVARFNTQNPPCIEAGNAICLRYETNKFDGVISAFCIRNVVDRIKAFAEMHRVLKPGGKAVVLELTRPNQIFMPAYKLYTKIFVKILGKLFSSNTAYSYLIDSINDFPDTKIMLAKMQKGGFEKATTVSLTGGIVHIFIGEKTG